jgi:hypothetical protein
MAKALRSRQKVDPTPKWIDAHSWTGEQFTAYFHKSMNYYNAEFKNKDLKPKVIEWMKLNSFDPNTISLFKKTKDHRCNISIGATASNLLNGMPDFHPGFDNGKSNIEWLKSAINKIIEEGKDDIEAEEESKKSKPETSTLNIQDRIREQAVSMSDEIDYAVDKFIANPESFDPKAFKMASLFRSKGVKSAQARYIKGFYEKDCAELKEVLENKDDQLKEGYKKFSKKDIKKLIDFYESINTACEQIAAEAKVLKKPRAKKVKPVEDLVKRVKFKLSDDKLGIASVPPAQLIGASNAIVYNTKTRKIGYYISADSSGLTVKGASIDNFTGKSMQKTLRKPPEQFKEFKEQNTQKRFETWFSKNIKTTETALNGRLNSDIIILKVYK